MIIAVDFDGVLCENKFPEIGKPHYAVISLIREIMDVSWCEVILWTSRTDHKLAEAVEWCKDYGLKFDAVNENAPSNIRQYETEFPNGTRKVFATYYLDDHNLGFDYREFLSDLRALLREIRKAEEEGREL